MRTMLRWTAPLTLCLLVGVACAQEAERGELWEVTTLEVAPGDIGAFGDMVKEIVAAAGMANMAAEYGWFFWSSNMDFHPDLSYMGPPAGSN